MRLTKLILFLAALLLLLPGTALAEPQEQLFLRQVSVGNFDVWQHTDGRWQDTDQCGQPDPYGLTNKTLKPEVFTLPQTQYTSGFTVTRVEIEYDFTLTNEELKSAGRSESWDIFNAKYITKLPNKYKAEKIGEDLAQGTVTVQKTLDLMPELLDLKDPAVREELVMTDQDFSDLAQGWRWYTPVLINWYGVPRQALQPPDFSVTLDKHEFKNMDPGDKVTLTATYKLNDDHPQPEKAKLGAFHVIGAEYPVTLEPLDPKDAPDNDSVIEFQPGEQKQYRITVTVQNRNSVVQAKVWPADASNDADWSNNSDEASILVPVNDIMVEILPSMNPWETNNLPDLVETTISVTRKENSGGNLPVKLTVQGPAGNKTFTFNLAPGQYENRPYNFTVSNTGNYNIKAEAWPSDGSWTDAHPEDNVDTEVIKVIYYQLPEPTDSKLHVEGIN
ncbi:hypothetical protein SAMN05660649_04812 [Desulfotomaculum arcticum]|uniref:CARDB protein n=1 Tax=Desulfotruncus arcticus DSM 17038 TaxID=1121424 RepID=A0A1I2Z852_9FIRM|nr:hypothetical protein [Desulfotruncus arcticus]SFH34078.1 hypothetical protein SAMN05660649_04812 [Desulfotomaculum arcticum] [Desulfotruncus arcticus DSM 17038]